MNVMKFVASLTWKQRFVFTLYLLTMGVIVGWFAYLLVFDPTHDRPMIWRFIKHLPVAVTLGLLILLGVVLEIQKKR